MALEHYSIDTVVIGAGVIGLACAREIARSGRSVFALEAGAHWGEGTSSRNSEVIHAGLYYPPDSLKARFCTEGRDLLYDYAGARNIPCRQTGKWIIASDTRQVAALEAIAVRARACGVPVSLDEGRIFKEALPEVRAVAGLYSPTTGIIDSHGLMLALLADLEAAGALVICQAPVSAVTSKVSSGDALHEVVVGGQAPCILEASQIVNAAGLEAIGLLDHWQGYPQEGRPQAYFAKGNYFSYAGRHPFSTLVYPVPEPGGLGVHLTLDIAGQARFGPDVEWIESPEYAVDSDRRTDFADSIARWWPGLDKARLQPAYAGVRPKLGPADTGFHDFLIQGPETHGLKGVVQLFGIESPGLTASLAIACHVAQLIDG
ncbi:NAD(P)/FAD-dependent oxidoreductase [Marinobacter sp. 1Y8]